MSLISSHPAGLRVARSLRSLLFLTAYVAPWPLCAQDSSQPIENHLETRSSIALINDTTLYQNLSVPTAQVLNQTLTEPQYALRYRECLTFSTSLIGLGTERLNAPADRQDWNSTQLRVRELYGKASFGYLDLTIGRKLVRWGTGYAFTAAGVLDPPILPSNPTDRLGLNVGRDLAKLDLTGTKQSLSLAWTTAALQSKTADLHEAGALRYNIFFHGFDTAFIAHGQAGGQIDGALTWTRVIGRAWETHGEAAWQEHPALLLGGKYTMRNGVDVIGEFYTPSPTAQQSAGSPLTARQNYAFFYVGKHRLRELPNWKMWDLSFSWVADTSDQSSISVFDISRHFGNHFTAYLHAERPQGSANSNYGSPPYAAAHSLGVRFQL